MGSASQSEALDADRDAANLEASLPGLYAEWQSTRHALAVLLGRTPDQAPPDLAFGALTLPAQVPVLVPSDLGLAPGHPGGGNGGARAADVGLATAQLFPRLSLTASMGKGGFNWPGALSSAGSIWGMGASLTQPIFHGGQLLAERRAAKLMYEASIEQYKQAVLSAFQTWPTRWRGWKPAVRRWPRPSPRAVPPNSPIAYREPRAAGRAGALCRPGQRTALHLGAIGRGAVRHAAADGNGGAVPGHGFAGAGARPGTRQRPPPPQP